MGRKVSLANCGVAWQVVTEPEFCYSGRPPSGGFLQIRAQGRTVLDEVKDWHDSFVVLSEHPTDMSTKLKHALCDLGITRQCSCRDYRHYMCASCGTVAV
jgi:hypothetical protein